MHSSARCCLAHQGGWATQQAINHWCHSCQPLLECGTSCNCNCPMLRAWVGAHECAKHASWGQGVVGPQWGAKGITTPHETCSWARKDAQPILESDFSCTPAAFRAAPCRQHAWRVCRQSAGAHHVIFSHALLMLPTGHHQQVPQCAAGFQARTWHCRTHSGHVMSDRAALSEGFGMSQALSYSWRPAGPAGRRRCNQLGRGIAAGGQAVSSQVGFPRPPPQPLQLHRNFLHAGPVVPLVLAAGQRNARKLLCHARRPCARAGVQHRCQLAGRERAFDLRRGGGEAWVVRCGAGRRGRSACGQRMPGWAAGVGTTHAGQVGSGTRSLGRVHTPHMVEPCSLEQRPQQGDHAQWQGHPPSRRR